MIFLTVGTQFGFDRLIRIVDNCIEKDLIKEPVFAQIGPGAYLPRNMEYTVSLEIVEFQKKIKSCIGIISHAGIGSISLALQYDKPLIVMPRLKKYDDVVNNHQENTAKRFEALGHVMAAYSNEEFQEKIEKLIEFIPNRRNPNRQGIIERIQVKIISILENNNKNLKII